MGVGKVFVFFVCSMLLLLLLLVLFWCVGYVCLFVVCVCFAGGGESFLFFLKHVPIFT